MLKNYLKIAWRNLLKHKAFSLINIGGLAFGMAAFILIIQYVTFELSYDAFHTNSSYLYRVAFENYNKGVYSGTSANTVSGLAPAIQNYVPGLDRYSRVHPIEGVVSHQSADGSVTRFNQKNIYYIDNDFLSMFSFPLETGISETALTAPQSAVLTQATARKYFGSQDPVGKTINISEEEPYIITGVLKEIPENTHFKFDLLLSYASLGKGQDENWDWSEDYTYVLLEPEINPQEFESQLFSVVTAFHSKGSKDRYNLQPIEDIHLYSNLERELSANSSAKTVYFLGIVALFILTIAWFNYINLAMAISLDRAKEVGIRKIMGAHRTQLVKQFILDTVVLNVVAMLLAILMVRLGFPLINSILDQPLPYETQVSWVPWLIFFGTFMMGVFLSAIYPALVQSGFSPIPALKARANLNFGGVQLRKILTSFQFAITLLLLIGVFTVFNQVKYMMDADLGIDIERTLIIKQPSITDQYTAEKYQGFKHELLSLTQIKNVTFSSAIPGELIDWHRSDIKLGSLESEDNFSIAIVSVDQDFVSSFGLKILAGENFQPDAPASDKSMIINTSAVKRFGFENPNKALGNLVFIGNREFEIIGVINDYHHQSLKENTQPILYMAGSTRRPNYAIKVSGHELSATVDLVREKWETTYPENAFEYFFLDDFFDRQYKADRQFGRIMGMFCVIAVLVACMGLFGLVLYTTHQKAKEIGIRKVLGASLLNIWLLVSGDYLKLVVLASMAAVPFGYWGVSNWLSNYAHKTDLTAWLFLMPILTILVLALITISFQTIKAVLANPVNSLRNQ